MKNVILLCPVWWLSLLFAVATCWKDWTMLFFFVQYDGLWLLLVGMKYVILICLIWWYNCCLLCLLMAGLNYVLLCPVCWLSLLFAVATVGRIELCCDLSSMMVIIIVSCGYCWSVNSLVLTFVVLRAHTFGSVHKQISQPDLSDNAMYTHSQL